MNITVKPTTGRGVVAAPPSKSMAHRQLICAALADGKSIIHNLSMSEDIKATIDCLRTIGAQVTIGETGDAIIDGVGGATNIKSGTFMCRESGSTLRFFIPISLLTGGKSVFHGSQVLMTRPMSVYEDICSEQGISFERKNGTIEVEGKLSAGNYRVPGNISSQFITGLLYVLPLLEGDSVIELIPPVESRSYILLTLSALKACGVEVDFRENMLFIKGNQNYLPGKYTVEGDWSNAAFLDAFNVVDGEVIVTNVNSQSLQGDKVYRNHFNSLAEGFTKIDISDCPDLGPILFTVAAMKNGGEFVGTKRLKIKESDRGTVMCEELAKCGVTSTIEDDRIVINKCQLHSPKEPLSGHNDHRIVMSLVTLLSVVGGKLEGAQAVNKSFPDYFDKIKQLGIDFSIEE